MIDNKRISFGQTDRYNVRLDKRNMHICMSNVFVKNKLKNGCGVQSSDNSIGAAAVVLTHFYR